MTTEYTNNGNGTGTLSISFTAVDTKVQAIGIAVAENLYRRGFEVPTRPIDPPSEFGQTHEPIPWDELTNLQKLELIDKYVKKMLLDMSRENHEVTAVIAARDTAVTEAANLYDIG